MSRFTFTIVNDTITGVTDSGSGTNEAIIPDSVTAILKSGGGLFQSNSNLHAFTCSNNSLLERIGQGTCFNCPNLTRVTLAPSGLTKIDLGAFGAEPEYGVTSKLSIINFPSTLKYIDQTAFKDCSKITSSLDISSVTYIGSNAFQGCTGITSLTLGEGLLYIAAYSFIGCSKISSLTIPDSVTFLGGEAFSGTNIRSLTYRTDISTVYSIVRNYAITSVTISPASTVLPIQFMDGLTNISSITLTSGLKRLGQECFRNCSNITSVNIPQGVTYIGPDAFYNVPITEITIPDSVTYLSGFGNCPNLKTVTTPIPKDTGLSGAFLSTRNWITSLTLLPSYALIKDNELAGFPLITTLTIPSNVTNLGAQAFISCTSLSSINIPDSVTRIGGKAFYSCSSLTSIRFPNSLNSMATASFERDIFSGCSSLRELFNFNSNVIDPQIHSFPTGTITNITINENCTSLTNFGGYSALKSITFPSSITGCGSFMNCSSLTSTINLPNVVLIPESAFNGCSSIQLVTYPILKRMNNYAFANCTSLTEIIIPSTVTHLGDVNTFMNCTSLRKLTSNSNTAAFASSYNPGTNPRVYITQVTISSDSTIINGVFDSFTSLPYIYIPSGIQFINGNAFNNCTSLTSIDNLANSSVTKINGNAFSGCTNLRVIEFPDSFTTVSDPYLSIFGGTPAIQHITFKPTTAYFFYNFASLTSVTMKSNPTFLRDQLFRLCSGLKTVDIPNSVTGMDTETFRDCTGLTTITMSSNITKLPDNMCNGCNKLRSINISNSMTSLTSFGNNCFWNCSLLTSINIPSSVTVFGSSSFQSCTSLTSLTIGGAPPIPNYTFDASPISYLSYNTSIYTVSTNQSSRTILYPNNVRKFAPLPGSTTMPSFLNVTEITIPESTTVLPANIFKNNTSINTVDLPESVTSISSGSFQGCSALTTVNIPTSLSSIGDNSFNGCILITSISLPTTLTSLGTNAFQNCRSLTEINIPNSITQLPSNTFYGCTSLTVAELPNTITTIGSGAYRDCNSITTVSANGTSLSIGSYAFANCTDLQTVTISNIMFTPSLFSSFGGMLSLPGGTSIGDYAFLNDVSLNFYSLPITTTLIGQYSFSGCTSLTDMTIPYNVELVSSYAFNNCTGLTNVTLDAPGTFTDLSANSFYGCVNVTGPSKVAILNKGYKTTYLLDAGFTNVPVICFNENTKITCLINGIEKDVLVQHIRKGFLVKTSLNGYKPVDMIGTSKMFNPGNDERIMDRLYVCSKNNYPELSEDLIITGCHAILVDNLTQKQREETVKEFGRVFATDKKYRLIAKLDERAKPYTHAGQHNIYHIALENENYFSNYGIYANGLLVETCSKRYLKELSKMTLL